MKKSKVTYGMQVLLLGFLCLFVFNALPYPDSLRHGKYLWKLCIPLILFLLILDRRLFDKEFARCNLYPWLPIVISNFVLLFIHGNLPAGTPLGNLIIIIIAGALLSRAELITFEDLFKVNAVTCFVLVMSGLLDVFIFDCKVPGELINQNIFAGIAILLGGFLILGCFESNLSDERTKVLGLLIGIATVILALSTKCRTALVCSFVLAIMVLFVTFKNYGARKTIVTAFLLFLFVFVYFVFDHSLFFKITKIATEFEGWRSSDEAVATSVGIRLAMWKFAFGDILPSYPFFGVGRMEGSQIAELFNYHQIDPAYISNWTHFHNDIVQMLVSGGGLQFLGGAGTFVLLYRSARRSMPLLWLLLCGLVFGQTEIFFFRQNTFVCFATLWILFALTRVPEEREKTL